MGFATVRLRPETYVVARDYGRLVHAHSQLEGAHNTPAAEERYNELSQIKGKYGELAFLRWVMSERLFPSHTPFRNDYRRRVDQDDFIINGVQLEVKSKRRGKASTYPPPGHYNANLGLFGLADHLYYVFVEICGDGRFEDGPECLILGWADRALIESKGRPVKPGRESDGANFPFQRHDWDIYVRDLREPATLIELLRERRDAAVLNSRGR